MVFWGWSFSASSTADTALHQAKSNLWKVPPAKSALNLVPPPWTQLFSHFSKLRTPLDAYQYFLSNKLQGQINFSNFWIVKPLHLL